MPGRTHRLRRAGLGACLACLAFAAVPSPASATFHLNKIREISGSTAGTNTGYVELQMYSPGQNLVSGHDLTLWDDDAFVLGPNPVATIPLTGPNPPSGQNQRTILIGDTGVPNRDFTVDFTPYIETGGGGGNNLLAAGAVCYEGVPIDCISWGGSAFTGSSTGRLPDLSAPYGNPLPTTFALRRKITAGCPTLLEASDDTNDNQADFAPVPEAPRPNSATPTEKSCGGAGNPPGFPNTKIKKRPKNRSSDDSPTFKFKSTESGSKFKCKLDRKKYKRCKSPKTYHGLDPGKHVFRVKAIDADGNADSTPAKDKFKVLP
jgi:hypothetical protein